MLVVVPVWRMEVSLLGEEVHESVVDVSVDRLSFARNMEHPQAVVLSCDRIVATVEVT